MAYPLLGENFYHDLQYTIDNGNKAIVFKHSQSNSALSQSSPTVAGMTVNSTGNYVYNVPFQLENHALIVVARLNGKECPMVFDTGADICLFTTDELADLGITVKATGRTMAVRGSSGTTAAALCYIDKAELGPISQPMPCLVTDKAIVPKPLLGQTFFKDWQYTIDHKNNIIQFIHR